MIIELDINGAKLIVSGENLSIRVIEGEIQRYALRKASPLAAWRRQEGMTQGELARLLDVDQSFVSRLESQRTSASLEDAVRIAELSGGEVPMASLVRRPQ